MATLNIAVTGIRAALRAIKRVERETERLNWRVLTRANRDIQRLYVRTLKAVIAERTTRRTGALLRVTAKTRRDRPRAQIIISPNFRATAYRTPFGRGRRGASKIGQYAFVVNHNREFIQEANRRVERSPELRAILRKHLAFIISEIEQGR